MVDGPPSEPETVWGACRALLQAGAGVAFVLEEHPTVGGLLIALSVGTAVYETVLWALTRRGHAGRARRAPRRWDRATAPRRGPGVRRPTPGAPGLREP